MAATEGQEQTADDAGSARPAQDAAGPTITAASIEDAAASGSAVTLTPASAGEPTTVVVLDTGERVVPRVIYPFGWSRADVRRAVVLALAACTALIFLWQVQSILPPFIIAFCIAALLDPTLRRYERDHGYSRVRTTLTLYLCGLLAVVAVLWFVVPAVKNQLTDITGHLDTYNLEIKQSVDQFMRDHTAVLKRFNIQPGHLEQLVGQQSTRITAALGGVTLVLGAAASKLLWLVIIPIATFFFMRDFPLLRARIITLFPEAYHERLDVMSREVVDVFSAYLRGLAKICAMYAVVACVLFWLLGLKYALFLGIMAGAFYAVPYVGQLFTAIGCGIVAYVMEPHRALFFIPVPSHSVQYTLTVVLCAVIAQNVFDQILYPRVVGGSVGLHPVVSIFALMAGATLFGIWGMLVAVPVAASLQIVLVYFFPRLTTTPSARLLETPPPLA